MPLSFTTCKYRANHLPVGVSLGVLVALLSLAGCGGSSPSKSTSPSGALAGNWQVALTSTSGKKPKVSVETGFLQQSGNQVSGNLSFLSASCSGTGAVTGTADSSGVALVSSLPGLSVNLSGSAGMATLDTTGAMVCNPGGSATGGNNCLSGNYILLANGCGVSESGTWSAFQVQPLSGSMSGTLTQNGTGVTSPASITLQQGANTGGTSATVTGMFTPGAGATACIPAGPVNGQVSGNSVILAIQGGPDNTIGTIRGQIQGVWRPLGNGTLTEPILDFTAKNSSYNFSIVKKCNLQNGGDPNCTPDPNNAECVTDPTCTPDPLDPSKCPGPTNPGCTGVKLNNCEAGKGSLCQSGAC